MQDEKVSTASGAENGVPGNGDKPSQTNTDTKASNVEKKYLSMCSPFSFHFFTSLSIFLAIFVFFYSLRFMFFFYFIFWCYGK